MSTPITIIGTLGGDPELRFTPSGAAVCNLSVAVNRGHKDRNTSEWVEDGTDWYKVTCWRDLANNVADSVTKGQRVIVQGNIEQSQWEDKDGNKRTTVEVQAFEVGPSLRWATAQVEKADRKDNVSATRAPVDPFGDPSLEPF